MAAKLPDIYGRKKILLIALVLLIIFSTAAPLAQNKETFFIVRSLVGLSMGLTGPVALTLTAEMVKSSHREIGPLCLAFSHFLGPFIVAIFAYLLLNLVGWRWFIVTQTVVPLIICLILAICFLPESPRYLMVSGQKEKALETLEHMAKKNGVCLPPRLNIVVQSPQNLGSISDILKSDFRKETILLSIMYFTNFAIYSGVVVFLPLALYSGFCGGSYSRPMDNCGTSTIQENDLLQLCIVTSANSFATGLAYIAILKLGRSVTLKVGTTIRLILLLFFFKCFSKIGVLLLFILISFIQVPLGMTIAVIVPELYPTIFRNTATAFIVSWGRLGCLVGAGSVYALYNINSLLVVGLFSFCALLAVIAASIWNKETKNNVIRDARDNLDTEFK